MLKTNYLPTYLLTPWSAVIFFLQQPTIENNDNSLPVDILCNKKQEEEWVIITYLNLMEKTIGMNTYNRKKPVKLIEDSETISMIIQIQF